MIKLWRYIDYTTVFANVHWVLGWCSQRYKVLCQGSPAEFPDARHAMAKAQKCNHTGAEIEALFLPAAIEKLKLKLRFSRYLNRYTMATETVTVLLSLT